MGNTPHCLYEYLDTLFSLLAYFALPLHFLPWRIFEIKEQLLSVYAPRLKYRSGEKNKICGKNKLAKR